MSDSKFKTYGAVKINNGPSFRREEQMDSNNKNKKHRLILSTLNVVPCQEYYQR